MNSMNKAVLIGNIGRDPEARSTATGKFVAKISLATRNARKVDGAWTESTDWHRLTAFGSTADYLVKFAKKGDLLAVEAALRPRTWTDREGKSHTEVDIVIDRVAALMAKRPREVKEEWTPGSETRELESDAAAWLSWGEGEEEDDA